MLAKVESAVGATEISVVTVYLHKLHFREKAALRVTLI